eukprot:scpid62967/ scgid20568/ Putative cysteine proteinase CG12163
MSGLAVLLCAAAALASPAMSAPMAKHSGDGADFALVVDAATFAVQEINRQENTLFAQVLSNIVQSTKETATGTGIKYNLLLETVRASNCMNDGTKHTLCTCDADYSQFSTYDVEVLSETWDRPSMNLLSVERSPAASTASAAALRKYSIVDALKNVGHEFQTFLRQYSPAYCNSAPEIRRRADIFKQNMKIAEEFQHNEISTAKYGITELADLTPEEFHQRYAMPVQIKPEDVQEQLRRGRAQRAAPLNLNTLPTNFDWRERNAVTAVKNQGNCGSCWSFSATGNIEGQWAIKTGRLVSLSEQELLDCDYADGACGGGLPWTAYGAVKRIGGLDTEENYPYQALRGTCSLNRADRLYTVNGTVFLAHDEAQMAAWLVRNGPISIGLNARAVQFYQGGIAKFPSSMCDPNMLDHAMLIVGFGEEHGTPFWIIKNSWGVGFGEEGYWRVYRGGNLCGLTTAPNSATLPA